MYRNGYGVIKISYFYDIKYQIPMPYKNLFDLSN